MAENQKMMRADFWEALSGNWRPLDSNQNLKLDLDLYTDIYCAVEGLLDEEDAEALAGRIQADPNALTCFERLSDESAARNIGNTNLAAVASRRTAFLNAIDGFLVAQSGAGGWAAVLSAFDSAKKSGSDLWVAARDGLVELLGSSFQSTQPIFGFRDSEGEVVDQVVGGVSTKQGGRYRIDFIGQSALVPGEVPSYSIRLEVLNCNLPGSGELIARLYKSDGSIHAEQRLSRKGTVEFSEIGPGRWLLSVVSEQSTTTLGDCFIIEFEE